MTRRYYRNSTLAFPATAEYACAIDRPRESRWSVILGCVAIGIVFAVIFAMGIQP